MRHLNLAAAVLLGVGMFTTHTAAQTPAQPHADAAMQETLSRRARAALEAVVQAKAATPRFEFKGDVPTLFPPVDCGMPVMTGNPAIDPQFSKQPMTPPGKSFWTMKVIPVKPCPR